MKQQLLNVFVTVIVKVQFFCLSIGKTRIVPTHKTSCSLPALARRQSVHNETFIDR
jgi:hypothetical protein